MDNENDLYGIESIPLEIFNDAANLWLLFICPCWKQY